MVVYCAARRWPPCLPVPQRMVLCTARGGVRYVVVYHARMRLSFVHAAQPHTVRGLGRGVPPLPRGARRSQRREVATCEQKSLQPDLPSCFLRYRPLL
jgi:hypothetical protein